MQNRALAHVAEGNLDEALADADKALELEQGDNSSIVDTRSYVYLKSGDYESASVGYEDLFSRGAQSAYSLLGGGVAYANLGQPDRAGPLLTLGLEQAPLFGDPDPQLADLIAMATEAQSALP